MIITLGFTESDRAAGYVSFSDGYRPGARQTRISLTLDGDGSALSAQQWAEAAYEASNHPGHAHTGPAQAIQRALADQAPGARRSLSVGDTVTVRGDTWACEPSGWRQIDTGQPTSGTPEPAYQPRLRGDASCRSANPLPPTSLRHWTTISADPPTASRAQPHRATYVPRHWAGRRAARRRHQPAASARWRTATAIRAGL
jgi:hypothetical protein